MPPDYLHNHSEFAELLRIVAREKSINQTLVEKDYWIMHCLYGLQQMNLTFELKGGTSLSKGYGLIQRFSEDIDIRIEPPAHRNVKIRRNQTKPAHIQSRKEFYDWLSTIIKINGIDKVERDKNFDDPKYFRSGGIRLRYQSYKEPLKGLKDGILLEVGFDNITPNDPRDISSWAYDFAADKVEIIDNRAKQVACYHPGYTLVEKLQAISTKYRQQQQTKVFPKNFMRHYYDVYCLLQSSDLQNFIGTPEYQEHKEKRFRQGDNLVIAENEAFLLSNPETYQTYEQAYQETGTLYYQNQPKFRDIITMFRMYVDKL